MKNGDYKHFVYVGKYSNVIAYKPDFTLFEQNMTPLEQIEAAKKIVEQDSFSIYTNSYFVVKTLQNAALKNILRVCVSDLDHDISYDILDASSNMDILTCSVKLYEEYVNIVLED